MPDDRRKGSGSDATRDEETSVFGSRSGSQSQTRSRNGLNGERSNDGEVSGSASVRIIKPPAESTSGPKLERAPKLDNQGILEMVEAGFSEGTILRKIESTMVDFDVSPKAVAELRRNRVSDKVIKAMQEAMDDGKAPEK